jgi:hypothetical protein
MTKDQIKIVKTYKYEKIVNGFIVAQSTYEVSEVKPIMKKEK